MGDSIININERIAIVETKVENVEKCINDLRNDFNKLLWLFVTIGFVTMAGEGYIVILLHSGILK